MTRTTSRHRCAEAGCPEMGFFDHDTKREAREHHLSLVKSPWRCTRHTRPDEVLTPTSTERVTTATAMRSPRYPDLDSLFWIEEGDESGSGFEFGPGFKAWAKDFPPGTRLIVTARVELPAANPTPANPQRDTAREGAGE